MKCVAPRGGPRDRAAARSDTYYPTFRRRVPFAILTPLIISICAVGAYSVNGRMLDIWYMLSLGVIGYVFKKLDYPLAPPCSRSSWATSPRMPCARA